MRPTYWVLKPPTLVENQGLRDAVCRDDHFKVLHAVGQLGSMSAGSSAIPKSPAAILSPAFRYASAMKSGVGDHGV
ncbi:MAG TPA: hypothetical protein VIM08_19065 [Arthrobacter sp.]